MSRHPQAKTPPEATRHTLTVTEGESNRRLDRFLAGRFPEMSRTHLQRLIRGGHVRVDEETGSRGARTVRAGATVSVEIPGPTPSPLAPEAIPLDILHEDRWLIAVNKPAGMVVHPGAGRRAGTLVHALMHHCTDLSGIGGVDRPGIVHRLDKDTSGVIVVAKDDVTHRHLARQFQDRTVTKVYLALVVGRVPGRSGTIDLPIGRDSRTRVRISSRTTRPREAITGYRVVETFADHTLLEVRPRTGRTHQIRVHLLHLGHPIAGDPTYGRRNAAIRPPRLALHAMRLEIVHPGTGRPLELEAPLPADLRDFIEELRA